MSKSPNELLITIRQYLSTIFGNDVLVLKLTNNPNFANIVAKGIAIHNNLEIICKTDEKITQKYVDNFKSRTGKDVNLNEFASITNLDDILDEVNYLNVAVKNLFDQKSLSEFSININNNVNLNIENNLENKNATSNSSNSTNETKAKESNSTKEETLKGERINNFNSRTRNPWSSFGMGNSFMNAFNQGAMGSPDIMYRAAAGRRLEYEIRIGKVYCWKQKPRSVLILQFIAIISALFYVLSGVAVIVAWIYAGSNSLSLTSIVNGQSQTTILLPGQIFSIIISPLFLIGFGLNMTLKYANDWAGKISPFKRKKIDQIYGQNSLNENIPKVNQNLQYHLKYNSIIYAGLVHVLFGFMPWGVTNPMLVVININNFSVNGVVGNSNSIVLSIFITNIILLASFLPLIFVAIAAKVLNPKQDISRLEEIVTKYATEMKNSGKDPFDIGLSDSMGGFGGGPFSGF